MGQRSLVNIFLNYFKDLASWSSKAIVSRRGCGLQDMARAGVAGKSACWTPEP